MGILEGKNIIITGSGRGIGKSIAIAFAKEGANIGITARSEDQLQSTKKEIENLSKGVKVMLKTADVANYEEIAEAFKFFNEELGYFNGVVANAGFSWMGSTHDFDIDKFKQVFDVNVLGVFYTFKAAYPYLKLDDKNNKARFVITGSAAYPTSVPRFTAYAASKYATVGMQRAMAMEYKKENLTINQVLPTMVDTRLARGRKAGDGNKPENVLNPWDLDDIYVFFMSDGANRSNDLLIFTNDLFKSLKMLENAPEGKSGSWDNFKDYLAENESKTYANVKKLGKLIDFIIERK